MLLGVPSICSLGMNACVGSNEGTVKASLQVGQVDLRPANSFLTLNFWPQEQEKEIIGASRLDRANRPAACDWTKRIWHQVTKKTTRVRRANGRDDPIENRPFHGETGWLLRKFSVFAARNATRTGRFPPVRC